MNFFDKSKLPSINNIEGIKKISCFLKAPDELRESITLILFSDIKPIKIKEKTIHKIPSGDDLILAR